MSWISQAGGAISKGWKDVTSGISTDKIAGSEQRPVGQYQVDEDMQKRVAQRQMQRQADLERGLSTIGARRTAEMGGARIATADQSQVRGQQQELANALMESAQGRGPSAAQAQMQLATDQNLRAALAMAASSRGNPALARQQAGRERALVTQQAAQQSAALRAQEQQAAQQLASQQLQGLRGQDIGLATSQAQLDQSTQQTNLQAALQQQAQIDAMRQFYEGQISGQVGGQTATDLAIEQMKQGAFQSAEGLRQGQFNQSQQNRGGFMQKILGGFMGGASDLGAAQIAAGSGGAGAGAAAASDERVKKNVSKVKDDSIAEFFAALEPKSYEYKNPDMKGQSEGEKIGLMAQDVEGTEIGQKLFSEDVDGVKKYDPQVLDGVMMAAIKRLMDKKGA